MVIPVRPQSSKMWEAVYFQFMYPTVHKRDRVENSKPKYGGVKTSYSLLPPPLWLATIAGVMWEGVLQGAAWDTVKFAVRRALDKLSNEGLVPPPEPSSSKERTFRAGWSQDSTSGRKQYEMFLSLKRTVRELPERHALAYARAKDDRQFGRIIRGEDEQPAATASKRAKKTAAIKTKAVARKGSAKR
jgi:hypothetical protein